jgi:uncharacterized protein
VRFLDSSAIVKLAVDELESESLKRYIAGTTFAASALARTEVIRAVHRREPQRVGIALDIVRQAQLISVTTADLDLAARLNPASLRSLDAIHLAAAMRLGGELEAFITYDERLLTAASALGMPVASPGA